MDTVTEVTEKILEILEYKFAFCSEIKPSGFKNVVISGSDLGDAHIRLQELDGVLRSLNMNYRGTIKRFWVDCNTNKHLAPKKFESDPNEMIMAEVEAAPNFIVKINAFRKKFLPAQSATNNLRLFVLDKDNLLHGKSGEVYPLGEGTHRFKVIKELLDGEPGAFHETKKLAKAVGLTVPQVQKAVKGIREEVENIFDGIVGENFVDSKRGLGYRLVPPIKVIKS